MGKSKKTDKRGRPTTLAAGCVVFRPAPGGEGFELLLAHRPKYNDWSFPKGHVEVGETELAAAIRETEEEVGVRGTIGIELPTVYRKIKGKDKRVRWWMMRYEEGEFVPNNEVDKVDWLSPAMAEERLTYPNDRSLVPYVKAGLGLST